MLRYARDANRMDTAAFMLWAGQLFAVLLFLPYSLVSAKAVDLLARSGRGLRARAICYIEFQPASILAVSLAVTVIEWIRSKMEPIDAIQWGKRTAVLTVLAAWAGTACIGVIRHWHPLVRLALHAAWTGASAGTVWLMTRA
jgi:hypothetical protein